MSTHRLDSPPGEPYLLLDDLGLAGGPVTLRTEEVVVPRLIDRDGVNIFVMMTPLLFLAQMGIYGAVLFTVSVIVYALRHRGSLGEVFRTQNFFLLFPAYAMLSAIWSEAQVDTLKHASEFMLTVVAALLMVQARNRRSLMFALFAAFAVYSLAPLMSGSAVDADGTTALASLSANNHAEAGVAATGAIITLAWFFLGFKTRRYFQSLLALPVLAVEIYSVVLARSAEATIAMAAGLIVFFLLAMLSRAGRRLRLVVVGFGGAGALALAVIFMIFTGPIIDFVSIWSGKEITLTGHDYLWARARDLIVEKPILGRGFAGFWQHGNLDAEGLWQFAHITSRTGFNFHNTGYDILVSLGWVGLILFALTLVVGLVKMAAVYVNGPSLLTAFWLALAASIVARLPVETMGIYEFSAATILLFAIFGYAVKAKRVHERQALQATRDAPLRGTLLSPIPPMSNC